MNPTHPVTLILLAVAALAGCAQIPADTATSQPLGVGPTRGVVEARADDRLAMMDSHMRAMRDMHERMRAGSPDQRQALRAEHMKVMQDGMTMMGGMGHAGERRGMRGMHGTGAMHGETLQRQQMLEKHMEMMQSMMQMMVDQMQTAPAKP